MDKRIYDYWVAGTQSGYIGNIVDIIDNIGDAESFYKFILDYKNGKDSNNIMLTKPLKDYFASKWIDLTNLERNYYGMMNSNVYYVNHTDSDFPIKLKNIPSPPYGLFVKGSLPDEKKKSVAIVGARECSEYGRCCAEYFGDRLAREGIQIISGMAWGIDGLSQMAAINAGGKSFGVLGCGVDVIYPRKNSELYRMLCSDGNGLISEYAPATEARSQLFPPRNRIISGLCDVLLVVEAKAKSGTLITVNMAIEQGKTIMTVPGRITDELSRGCLMLTKEGAMPAISVESVLEELGYVDVLGEEYVQLSFNTDNLTEDECRVLRNISLDPVGSDELSIKCKLDISRLLMILSKLELMGHVREIAPGMFVIKS